jgi:hypothetical protein
MLDQPRPSRRMVIGSIGRTESGGMATVAGRIDLPEGGHDMWFRAPAPAIPSASADPFLIACLPVAMSLGLPVVIENGAVSRQLMARLETAQQILRSWNHGFSVVPVSAPVHEFPARAAGSAAFFSGGVDSFYTALRHRDRLSSLVLIHGFDMALENVPLRDRVRAVLAPCVASLGLSLVEVETNQRAFTDRFVSWPLTQFGPALASVGVLLSGLAHEVLIPASESYAHPDPCGSHPLLDPLWSTEAVTICHDGADATRNEKIASIGRSPGVLSALRVCWENPDDAYNCGRCEKCLRTMISLEAVGLLKDCSVFDAGLTTAAVRRMSIPLDLMFYHVEENLRVLKTTGTHAELVHALEHAVARYQAASIAKRLGALGLRRWPLVAWALGKGAVARARRGRA